MMVVYWWLLSLGVWLDVQNADDIKQYWQKPLLLVELTKNGITQQVALINILIISWGEPEFMP